MKNTQVTLIKKTIQRSMIALMLSGVFSAIGFTQHIYAICKYKNETINFK